MSRTVDEARLGELREAILRYFVEHGLNNLSLRPLAKAVGSSPRGLLYHFGSKENMVIEVLAELRRRQRAAYAQASGASFGEACREMWVQFSSPAFEPQVRLFFEVYGLALSEPSIFESFLKPSIDDWLKFSEEQLRAEGLSHREARVMATCVLAGFRGFMLDQCATHDRERIGEAVNLWLASLDAAWKSVARTRSAASGPAKRSRS
jgi:AcrR family transcriptional regulator